MSSLLVWILGLPARIDYCLHDGRQKARYVRKNILCTVLYSTFVTVGTEVSHLVGLLTETSAKERPFKPRVLQTHQAYRYGLTCRLAYH
jgi:hypothetical protein